MDKHFFKYFISVLLFGSNGIIASNINLTSYEIVLWRTLIGSALLISLFFISGRKVTFPHYKKDMLFIVFSGISMGTSWMFLYEAYFQIGVSLAILLYYTGPVIVMVLSPLLFKEKLGFEKVIGFVAVLIGTVFINSSFSADTFNGWGIFCGLMSAVTYSFMVIFNKKSVNITGLENSAIQLLISFFTVSIFFAVKTGFHLQIQKADILWVLLLGIVNTGIGCYLYFSSISHIPVQTVAICGCLEPLSSVILAVIILHEWMSLKEIIGAVLIIGGAFFAEYLGAKKHKSKE